MKSGRLLALLLALTMLLGLAACGNGAATTPTQAPAPVATEAPTQPEEPQAPEEPETPEAPEEAEIPEEPEAPEEPETPEEPEAPEEPETPEEPEAPEEPETPEEPEAPEEAETPEEPEEAVALENEFGRIVHSDVEGTDAFYFVPADFSSRSVCSGTVFVYADNLYFDEASAMDYIVSNGLADFAAENQASVVVFNPLNGESWEADDLGAYAVMFGNFSDGSDATIIDGIIRGEGVFGGNGKYPGATVGSDIMVWAVGDGAGADFINAYIIDGDNTTVSNFGMDVLAIPNGVVLFGATAVPTHKDTCPEEPIDRPVIAWLYNCSDAVAACYTALNSSESETNLGQVCETYATKGELSAKNVKDGLDHMKDTYRYWVGGMNYEESYYQLLAYPDYAANGIAVSEGTRTIGEQELHYRLYVPETVDTQDDSTKVPVILNFHGAGNTAEFVVATLNYPIVGKEDNLVVLGIDAHNRFTNDEIMEFVHEMYAENPAFDETRLYVSGFSMGGVKTASMISSNAMDFAGAAPMSAGSALTAETPVTIPYFYVGGENSFLAEVPSSPLANAENFDAMIESVAVMNSIPAPEKEEGTAWGLAFDNVETVDRTDGYNTITIGYLNSEDGNCYTVFSSTANMTHATLEFNAAQAWNFLKHFSRGADGVLSIDGTPVE